jgi:hypothetical protein
MKKVEDHLLAVFNALSKDKHMWEYVTNEQKEKFFFIINRNLSKIFLNYSSVNNDKRIDKSHALDIWFYYLYDIPYNSYTKKFWSKVNVEKSDEKENISIKDFNLLLEKLKVKNNDLDFLIKNYKSEVIEELKYLNKIKN